jgi:hypothetical protein
MNVDIKTPAIRIVGNKWVWNTKIYGPGGEDLSRWARKATIILEPGKPIRAVIEYDRVDIDITCPTSDVGQKAPPIWRAYLKLFRRSFRKLWTSNTYLRWFYWRFIGKRWLDEAMKTVRRIEAQK